jgi:hypothetical protein
MARDRFFWGHCACMADHPYRRRAVIGLCLIRLSGTESQTIAFRLCVGSTRRTGMAAPVFLLPLGWLGPAERPQRARFGSRHPGPWLPTPANKESKFLLAAAVERVYLATDLLTVVLLLTPAKNGLA